MTALNIQNAEAISAPSVRTGKVYPPKVDGLRGLFFLGGSINESIANRSPWQGAQPNAIAVGAPAVNASYLTLKNMTNYLQTQIAEVEEMTLIAWHTAEYLNFNAISNTWTTRQGGTGNSYGVSLAVGGGSSPATGKQNRAIAGYKTTEEQTAAGSSLTTSHTAVINGGGAGSYMTHAARFTATEVCHDILTNASGKSTALFGSNIRDKASGLLRIGSSSVGGADDAFNMCGAIIAEGFWSDEDLSDCYAWLSALELDVRGISV
ncbi:hypothetical protein ACFSUK_28670 [Sphingobium scionense]|uniref:Uncharacterized protein n=1 Tax=Sphingobium scionense TaxID=1404341 RepID=A0A7W6LPL1_9SPHN|nr:hypothetical protein [Sphingobium scionense]MBB4148011.1 hypothetical protein [Sphingobium scionense]